MTCPTLFRVIARRQDLQEMFVIVTADIPKCGNCFTTDGWFHVVDGQLSEGLQSSRILNATKIADDALPHTVVRGFDKGTQILQMVNSVQQQDQGMRIHRLEIPFRREVAFEQAEYRLDGDVCQVTRHLLQDALPVGPAVQFKGFHFTVEVVCSDVWRLEDGPLDSLSSFMAERH